jgi:hypothetical protein
MFDEWILPNSWQVITAAVAITLHQRSAWRLHLVMMGILFAKGRKTITSWLRAAGIVRQYKAFYYFIGAMGGKTETIATVLFEIMIGRIFQKQNRVLMAIDDTATTRYGPKVEGAGPQLPPMVPSLSTATSGSSSRPWFVTNIGGPSPCPCWQKCTSEPEM